MSFQSNEDQRKHRHSNGQTLDERDQATQQRPKHPVIHQRVNHSERQTEDTDQDVRERQIADENTGDVDFFFAMSNDAYEPDVTNQPEHHCDAIPHHQNPCEGRGHVTLLFMAKNKEV